MSIFKNFKNYHLLMILINGILSLVFSGIAWGLIFKGDLFFVLVFFALGIATLINTFEHFDKI